MLTAHVCDATHSNSTRQMLMPEFLDWWEGERPAGGEVLYLKDWTLAAQQPQYDAYVCPAHFQVTLALTGPRPFPQSAASARLLRSETPPPPHQWQLHVLGVREQAVDVDELFAASRGGDALISFVVKRSTASLRRRLHCPRFRLLSLSTRVLGVNPCAERNMGVRTCAGRLAQRALGESP